MYIETTAEDAATGELAEFYRAQKDNWGFLPEFAHCFAARPQVAHAWSRLNLTIREAMDRRRYEVATIAAARALKSTYCTVAHASALRDACADLDTVRALMLAPAGEPLSEADAKICDFAAKVATDASTVRQEDVDDLRDAGLSDADITDIVLAASARAFFTKVLDGLGARLDPQIAATFDPDLLDAMIVGNPVREE